MAATIVIGLKRLATSFWRIKAGRVFLISAPMGGSKLTRKTSPRLGTMTLGPVVMVRLGARTTPRRAAGRVRLGRGRRRAVARGAWLGLWLRRSNGGPGQP